MNRQLTQCIASLLPTILLLTNLLLPTIVLAQSTSGELNKDRLSRVCNPGLQAVDSAFNFDIFGALANAGNAINPISSAACSAVYLISALLGQFACFLAINIVNPILLNTKVTVGTVFGVSCAIDIEGRSNQSPPRAPSNPGLAPPVVGPSPGSTQNQGNVNPLNTTRPQPAN